jgi:outer membrane immunogenic protein
MKKFLLGSVALAAMLAGPAMAAELPYKAPPPPPPPAYYDWSGAYLGFNIGGIWNKVDQHFTSPGAGGNFVGVNPDFSTDANDGVFGFHAGAQWQWGIWVLGVEAALSGCFDECRGTSGILGPVGNGLFAPNTFVEHKLTNLFTVGPRVGWAWDRWMIFATGGWASANLKSAACNALTGLCDGPGSNFNGASRNNNGWYAGGGFDYMVHKGSLVDVILGVEYQHYDVRGQQAFCFNPGCNVANGFDYDLSAKGDIVRARLTIKTEGYGIWGSAPAPTY